MAVNNIKISRSLIQNLSGKLNSNQSSLLTHFNNNNNRTLLRNRRTLTTTLRSSNVNLDDSGRDNEDLDADNKDLRPELYDTSYKCAIPHDAFIDFMKSRQLQPAYQPEFMHSCLREVIPINIYTFKKEPPRSDSLQLKLRDVGSAIPFNDTKQIKDEMLSSIADDYNQLGNNNNNDNKSSTEQKSNDIKLMNMLTRNFSSKTVKPDSDKCNTKKKKKCEKIKMDCEPAKDYTCRRKEVVGTCTKQESPYPSYSESCHEEWEQKPDECKMCPWPLNKHPTFKPTKKKFHTTSNDYNFLKRSLHCFMAKRDECPPPPKPKEPCGWVNEDKTGRDKKEIDKDKKKKTISLNSMERSIIFDLKMNDAGLIISRIDNIANSVPKEKPVAMSLFKEAFNYHIPNALANLRLPVAKKVNYLRDEITTLFSRSLGCGNLEYVVTKKKPCDKPPPKCPENKEKPKKEDKKCIEINNSLAIFTEKDDATKTPCKKFPFPPPPRIPYKRQNEVNRCKVKKKRKIKDCPGEKVEECKETSSRLIYSIKVTDKDRKDDAKKCPKIDLGKCDDNVTDPDDPCGIKKTGVTRQCPADLTKKKRKYTPKKKTDAPNRVPPDAPHL